MINPGSRGFSPDYPGLLLERETLSHEKREGKPRERGVEGGTNEHDGIN